MHLKCRCKIMLKYSFYDIIGGQGIQNIMNTKIPSEIKIIDQFSTDKNT